MTDTDYWPHILCDRFDDEQIAHHVKTWWARLTNDEAWLKQHETGPAYPAGVRATLRRARQPDDVLLTEGFRHLWFALPDARRKSWDMPAWGCVAAVLAEIRTDTTKPFATAMASPADEGQSRPRVSELRFNQLLHSRNLDEVMRRARRVIQMLGNEVHVISVADGLLHWHREKNGYTATQPDRRLAVRWASDYYAEYERRKYAANAS